MPKRNRKEIIFMHPINNNNFGRIYDVETGSLPHFFRGDLPALLLLLHKLFMAYTLNNRFVGVLCASLFEKQKKRDCHENVVIFSAPHFMDLSEMRV